MIDVTYAEGEVEMFVLRGELAATQPFYFFIKKPEHRHEVKHFYCGTCGEEWGLRISPSADHPSHYFYRSRCSKCGGVEHMLSPFELEHIDILSTSVLAHVFLSFTNSGVYANEIPENSHSHC